MMLMPVQILADAGASHPLRLEGTQSALWTVIQAMKPLLKKQLKFL